jgi:ribonuclease-3
VSPEDFARKAGLTFRDPGLLWRALTHRSYVNEHTNALEDNERLEFLGDAALDFLSAAWLYRRFPEMDEGKLTRLRSALVRTEQLAAFARDLGLGEVLLLGRGEESSGGRTRDLLLCGAFEAVLGAVFVDQGIEAVAAFVEPRLQTAAEAILGEDSQIDPRSLLQIWAQAERGETPRYRTIDARGPDHARQFVVEVTVGAEALGRGEGHSKQEAAHQAAADALTRLNRLALDRS